MLYPSRGNFIGFVGNASSRELLTSTIKRFRESTLFPSELPGIGWSDHWSFWQQGYRAIMITDTAPFRYPYYHTPPDTEGRIDYQRMARVVDGIHQLVASLATDPSAIGPSDSPSPRAGHFVSRTMPRPSSNVSV